MNNLKYIYPIYILYFFGVLALTTTILSFIYLFHVKSLLGEQIVPSSDEDQTAKLYLCSKYLETFTHVKDRENFVELSIDLLVGMIDLLLTDIEVYLINLCFSTIL